MRSGAVVAVAVALLGAAAWLALRGPGEDGGPLEEHAARPPGEAPPPAPAVLEGRAPPPPSEPPVSAPVDGTPKERPPSVGARLHVQVAGPDGPVAARVTATDAAGKVVALETDGDGDATFEGLAAGRASVDVSAAGFSLAWEASADLTDGQTATLGIRLERGASVDGRVVAARDGRPIAGASVDVRGGGAFGGTATSGGRPSYGVVRTDADGRFRTPGLPFDFIVTMVVRARGFRRVERSMLLLPLAGERPALDVRLDPGGAVRGTVADADGDPVPGARVVVAPEGREHLLVESDQGVFADPDVESAFRAETDATGRYVVEGLRFDVAYRAVAFAAGHAPSRPVDLRTDESRPEARADLALVRPATVVVHVRGPAGEVVKEGTVRLGAAESALDAGGTATFPGLSPGDASIDVQAAGFVRARETVSVPEGRVLERTIPLQRGGSLAGVVVDDLGRPVADARVTVLRVGDDGGELGGASTDPLGRFSVGGLPAGEVSVRATADAAESRPLERVRVPGPDVRLVLLRNAEVVARLALPGGTPPPKEVWVTDYDLDGSGGGGTRGWEDGRVSWDVPAGKRVLRIRVPGLAPWEREVETAPGETLDLGEVALDAGSELVGRVTDPAGRPVAGAVVEARGTDGAKGQSDVEGRFRLEHLPRRPLRISVEASGFVATTVTADPSSAPSPLHVRLHRGGRLVVTLADAAGAPPAGVRVHVHAPTAPDPDAQGLWAWEAPDDRGRVAIRLAPGAYRVDVLRGEAVVATASAALEEEQETSLEIRVPGA